MHMLHAQGRFEQHKEEILRKPVTWKAFIFKHCIIDQMRGSFMKTTSTHGACCILKAASSSAKELKMLF